MLILLMPADMPLLRDITPCYCRHADIIRYWRYAILRALIAAIL